VNNEQTKVINTVSDSAYSNSAFERKCYHLVIQRKDNGYT